MLYKLVNKKTNEVKEVIWTIAEKEKYLSENPEWFNCLDKVPTFILKGQGWFSTSRNESLKGQAALDNALAERDAVQHDFEHSNGQYRRANYLHEKASEKIEKEI